MALRFTPPKNENLPRYASYGAGQMKTHREIGPAKQSLLHRTSYIDNSDETVPYYRRPRLSHEGFILENVDGEWYTLYHVEEGTSLEDLPWKRERWVHRSYGWTRFEEPTYKPEDYRYEKASYSMSRDQYAEWRLAVELEKRGIVD